MHLSLTHLALAVQILQTVSIMIWNLVNQIAMYDSSSSLNVNISVVHSHASCRILVRDIMYWPQWTFAAKKANVINQNLTADTPVVKTHVRESLSNILLTYIDFRRPNLDYRRTNSTKVDETIEKVPESCIEEFNLYVSTWKGWQGPLPSKDNSITWDQVERDNTIFSTISCTHVPKEPIESFDDLDGNSSNSSNDSTTIPTPPPLPTAESFR